ncbi:MAG: putative ABC-type phosphate/phosphonate transport system, periplasmic component [Rhodocyclaceae bacterium]|nr:putative ABC-type phosphate/phosphonate transport system, periplasmic component [Rhodocyclaceae bacterium]
MTPRAGRWAGCKGWLPVFLSFLLVIPAWAQAADTLRLGIMPFNTPLALMRVHQPLREHLQAKLGMPVEILTSPDFPRYVADVRAGRFDVIVLAPHFAVLAYQDSGFRPLFHYLNTLEPLLVVRRDSGIEQVGQVRGRTVAVASKLALVTIVGLQRFRQEGIGYPRDLRLQERVTHGAAIAAVAVGDVDTALTVETTLRQVPEDVRAKVRTLHLGVALPHLVTMANPALDDALVEKARAAFASFPATEAGRRFFADTGYGGYHPLDRDDIRKLAPYADIARELLNEGKAP